MQSHKRFPEVDQWIRQEMEETAKYAYPAGLYELPDEYKAIAEARVRSKMQEIYPDAAVDSTVLHERYLELSGRKESFLRNMRANPLPDIVAQIVGSNVPKAFFFWRGPAAVTIILALWGLLHHERSWDRWCVLFLGAALATLVLQAVPVVVRVASGLAATTAEFVRSMTSLRSLDRVLVQVESSLTREQELRRESQQWSADTTALLLAQYEHNKNIARRARLVA